MVELVGIADVITPNLTEAAMLIGKSTNRSNDIITGEKLACQIIRKGPDTIVMTSIILANGEIVI